MTTIKTMEELLTYIEELEGRERELELQSGDLYEEGYQSGYREGTAEGHEIGHRDGYEAGYEAGSDRDWA